ncbi:MAG TPA: dephospho-CoA kinase [Abditibacterium sp.]|jgi:dephospho-CoA kinase
MRILGLTGDIACGKTSVAQMLEDFGAVTLDADLLVRELYADRAFAARVQALFETPILDPNAGVDRVKLGALVFGNAAQLRRLEVLVHPAVAAVRKEKLRALEASGQKVVVLEAVKLLESGQGTVCDAIWCVVCSAQVQIERLMTRRGLSEAQARARLQNQPSREAKQNLAQPTPLVWLENDGDFAELRALVARHWTLFLA